MGVSSRFTSKVSFKIWAGFIAILLIMAFVVGFSYLRLNDAKDKLTTLEARRVKNLLATEALALATADQTTYILGYILTGEESFLHNLDIETAKAEEEADYLNNNVINKAMWEPIEVAFKDFQLQMPKMVSLYDEEGQEAAIEYLGTVAEAVRDKFYNEIDGYVKYQEELISEDVDDIQDAVDKLIYISIILLAVALTVGIIIAAFISRIISRPLVTLTQAANKLAAGDLDVDVRVSSRDEIGVLAMAFAKMTDNTNEAMTNINVASEQVASGSGQVSDSSMALSQGAAEQASSIEELTASLEEIASQTKLNADNATEANNLADAAKVGAEQGNEQMDEMLKAMEDINESSSNISKIIKVIDEIAFQTNILALNAAVEAARAGQHGKGFAVVAEEVRNLAARSANAAKETTDMIEDSIKKAEGGTKIAKDTAEALKEIVEDVAKAAALVGDITIASNEQASAIEQINQGVMQVSQVVQSNSATAEESAAASEELSSQADLLRDIVGHFKLKGQAQGQRGKGDENGNMYSLKETTVKNKEESHKRDITKKIKIKANDEKGSDKRQPNKNEAEGQKQNADAEAAASDIKIVLNDSEFGKY